MLKAQQLKPRADFRHYLQQELVNRCNKNPKYSLRAFARSLGVQAPTLSHLLRGSRPLTPRQIQKLGQALDLGPGELAPYLAQKGKQKEGVSFSGMDVSLSQLSADTFSVLADWYHFAILELAALPGFKSDAQWIARVLGISVSEVNIAIERLLRLDLLEASGRVWRPTHRGNTTLGTEFTHVALRRVQRQFLEKAIVALEETPAEKRDHAGLTVNLALRDLPEVKKRIKAFRRELMTFVERHGKSDEVYQFTTALYPLTQIGKEKL